MENTKPAGQKIGEKIGEVAKTTTQVIGHSAVTASRNVTGFFKGLKEGFKCKSSSPISQDATAKGQPSTPDASTVQ